MDSVHTLSHIYKEIEFKVNQQLLSILQLRSDPNDILKRKNLERLESDICNKYSIITGVTKTDDVNDNIKSLDALLSTFLINSKETNWASLSKNIQECLLDENDELFKRGLKIHYKLITTSTVTAYGYLNLIDTLNKLRNTLNLEKVHKRTCTIIKFLLKTQSTLIKNINPSKIKMLEEISVKFIDVLCSNPLVPNILAKLDENANWLIKFCYIAHNRKFTLNHIKKTNLIVNFIIPTQFNVLKNLFQWEQNLFIFPLQTANGVMTLNNFVVRLIEQAKFDNNPSLICLLTQLFKKRPALIINREIRQKLFESFLSKRGHISTYRHVLGIVNELGELPHASKYLCIKPNSNNASVLEKHNLIEIVTNLTIMRVRNFVNESEMRTDIDENLFDLIDCCVNLIKLHRSVFNYINFTKLIEVLVDFYEAIHNYTYCNYYCTKIAIILCSITECDYSILNILEKEKKILKEIIENALKSDSYWCNLFLCLSYSKEGCAIIESHYHVVIKNLLLNLWGAETEDEYEMFFNKFLQMMTVLNNFNIIKALLHYENEDTLCSSQEKPVTLSELIENCLDINYLGTVDVILGLRCIKIFVTNLDVLLYLLHTYNLRNIIELQVKNKQAGNYLSDEYSILRQYILLTIEHTGTAEVNFNQIKFITAPYQSTFIPRTCNTLQKFLHAYKNSLHDHNWVMQVRKLFKISCKGKYKTSVVLDLMNQMPKPTPSVSWPTPDAILYELQPEDAYGVEIIIEYGIRNNLLHSSVQNDENLTMLLKQSRTMLGYTCDEFLGFDWFVAVMFLMSSGKLEKCKLAILGIINIPVAPIIWTFVASSSHKKQDIVHFFYRQLEIILEDNTRINYVLKSMDTSAKHLAQEWLRQCFFSILNFKEICNFLCLAILYPPEYILFYLIALFEHCKDDIFTALQSIDSAQILKISCTSSFQVLNYFNLMDNLHKRYKNCLHI
ncbi:hypothetical protein FQA39_LY10353 [Lamprigera yunnana]|nr:hypothetical protein FQA39_LY10353 [Lamprigera yunnana]